ncbi:MAG: hypothetical protein QNJ47_22455 [Nostocaceae cyanobacterium]|nr:hypothetical protein [Nostocaceae cyanobacterium]
MNTSSRYWNMWRINPAGAKLAYRQFLVPLAKEFAQKHLDRHSKYDINDVIVDFKGQRPGVNDINRALAGLCLRCYVSEAILKACKQLYNKFAGEKQFTYHELLRFVLDDDGETLVILDRDGKNQLILDNQGEVRTAGYQFFTVKVLQTFNPNSQSSMSLDNWAFLKTKQNPKIKAFLSDFGFRIFSDWALLNRVRPKQLEGLSEEFRHLVEVFHGVYRRDRRQQQLKGSRQCPDPSSNQLQEMLTELHKRDVFIQTTNELMKELKRVVKVLRQYDIWSNREPLEFPDPETGNLDIRKDLPYNYIKIENLEEREFTDFLHEQLMLTLASAIEKQISHRITKLQKKRYASFVEQFIPGLRLYYCEAMSLRDIAPILGMSSRDQARRILNPGELLSNVRTFCLEQLLEMILQKVQEMDLTTNPPEPDYLKRLVEKIDFFADTEVFQEAAEELRAGKNRSMDSVYAQQLRLYLSQH